MASLQPGHQPAFAAERMHSHDLLDDFLRPSGKDGNEMFDLDGSLFGPELWDVDHSSTASPSDGVVPHNGLGPDMDRASSSSSSSNSNSTQASPPVCPEAATASLLAYFSYPQTMNTQHVVGPTAPAAPWQMMPVGPLMTAQLPPPYRPKWQPVPGQVPSPSAPAAQVPSVLAQAPTTVPVLAIKSEPLSEESEDVTLRAVKAEPVVCLPVGPEAEVEGDATVGFHSAFSSSRQLDRKERVRRYQEKRKRRTFEKTIRYQSRKAYAEVRPRIKGRFATREEVKAMKAAAAAGLPYCPPTEEDADDDSCDDDDMEEYIPRR